MPRKKTSSGSQIQLAPGDFIKHFGIMMGWGELAHCNLMVEGTTDVQYFEIASDLYQKVQGTPLIDADFRVFAVGEGNEGGTHGIHERLRQLSGNLRVDPVDAEGREIRVVCLMDDDHAGKGTFTLLKNSFKPWQDIFRVQRVFPTGTRDPSTFGRMWNRVNKEWKDLPCETEDLIKRDLLDYFVSENANALKSPVSEIGDAYHFDFNGYVKPALARFLRKHATLEDILGLVNVLNEFRWLMGLNKC